MIHATTSHPALLLFATDPPPVSNTLMIMGIINLCLLILGLILFFRPQIPLPFGREVYGKPVIFIATVFVLPLLIAQGGGFVIGFFKGVDFAKRNRDRQLDPNAVQEQLMRELERPLTILNLVTTSTAVTLAVLTVLLYHTARDDEPDPEKLRQRRLKRLKKKQKQARQRDEEEDED